MDFDEYQAEAAKTSRQFDRHSERLCMAAMGLAGEAGEVVDELKKVVFHGRPFDSHALGKELGDVLWYLAELASATGFTLAEIAEMNIAKLRKRHGEAFKPHGEQNREGGA